MPHRQRSRSRDRRDRRSCSTWTERSCRNLSSSPPLRAYSRREHGHHDRQVSSRGRSSHSDHGRSDRYSARRARDERHRSRSRTRNSPARGRSDRDLHRSRSRRRYHSPAHHRHERHQSLAYSRRNDRHNSRDRHSRSRRQFHERHDRNHSRGRSNSSIAGSGRYEQHRSRERHSQSRRIHDCNAIDNPPRRQDDRFQDSRADSDAAVPRRTGQTLAAPTLSPSAATTAVQIPLNNGAYDSESWRFNSDGRRNSVPALGRTTGGLNSHRSDGETLMVAGVVASHAPTSTAVRLGPQPL